MLRLSEIKVLAVASIFYEMAVGFVFKAILKCQDNTTFWVSCLSLVAILLTFCLYKALKKGPKSEK